MVISRSDSGTATLLPPIKLAGVRVSLGKTGSTTRPANVRNSYEYMYGYGKDKVHKI